MLIYSNLRATVCSKPQMAERWIFKVEECEKKTTFPEVRQKTKDLSEYKTEYDKIYKGKNPDISREDFAKLYDSFSPDVRAMICEENDPFFPLTIKNMIRSVGMFTVLSVQNEFISLEVYFPEGQESVRRVEMLFRRANAMRLVFEPKLKLSITIYHLNAPKRVSLPFVINSGYTEFQDNKAKKIVIYRREELLKVLTHEMIHACRMDRVDGKLNHYNGELVKKCCVCNENSSDMMRVEEAYTDTWAIIINSLLLHRSGKELNWEQLRDDIAFSVKQCALLVKFFGFETVREIGRPCSNKCISQHTSFLSYYVVKSSLLWLIEEFMGTFPNLQIDAKKYEKLVHKSMNNSNWQDAVDEEIRKLPQHLDGISLRMSKTLS